eukprot:COSAG02_NODE_892_length_16138_cov_14.599875_2_plen_76_part_00
MDASFLHYNSLHCIVQLMHDCGAGLRARTVTEVSFEHAADKDLDQICVRLGGNNGVHLAEIRAEFGFGSPEHQAE